jgi:putative hydrolase
VPEPGPEEGSGPFDRLPFFSELSRIPAVDEPVNWPLARRVAVWVAGEGEQHPEGRTKEQAHLVELVRVAELQVATATGLPTTVTGSALVPLTVTPAQWASRGLDAHLPLLTALATALTKSMAQPGESPDTAGESEAAGQPAPSTLKGFVFGWMLGQLARRSLGQYDLPLPWPPFDKILFLPANLDDFAAEWSLPGDDLRLWVCLREVTHHAVLGLTHVRERFQHLLNGYVAAFDVDSSAFADQLGALDMADPSSFRSVMGDPESVVASMENPRQRELLGQLEALVSVLEGYVDHVLEQVGAHLVGDFDLITESMRRRRVEASWGDRFVAKLLGVELRQRLYDRGHAFVRGVLERAGEEGLASLWRSPWELPTPAEIEAPGLWLARLELGPET